MMATRMTLMTTRATAGTVAVAFLGVALQGSPARAQAETKARKFMREVIGFTPAEFQALDGGKVVTRQLETIGDSLWLRHGARAFPLGGKGVGMRNWGVVGGGGHLWGAPGRVMGRGGLGRADALG